MNKFFKAVRSDGVVLDVAVSENKERASVNFLFRPWHHCFLSFDVVECSRQEWFDWKWPKRFS